MSDLEKKIAHCLELSRKEGSDTEYWLRRMNEFLDKYGRL